MNLARIGKTVVAVGGAAAWLLSATPGRHTDELAPLPSGASAAPKKHVNHVQAGEVSTLDAQVERLRDGMAPAASPREPGRNLFRFAPRHPPGAEPSRAELTDAATAQRPAPAPVFRLSGIAEDPGPSGPVRTAVIAGLGQLFLVKEGENVTPFYRVTRIGADAVELVDLTNNSALTLIFK